MQSLNIRMPVPDGAESGSHIASELPSLSLNQAQLYGANIHEMSFGRETRHVVVLESHTLDFEGVDDCTDVLNVKAQLRVVTRRRGAAGK